MSERLDARAEVVKLARVLSLEEAELAFLRALPAAELRQFREQATNRLFDSGASMLGRVGAAAKLLPSGLIATIAQRSFGPLLCARAAGTVDTAKAIDVARRLPAGFLADVTVELDPRRVAAIIAEVPEELVVPVAEELGRRKEHVTMGRFIAYVADDAIAAAIGALDDEAMLRTAFVREHKDRLDHAVGLLPPDRLPSILSCAAANDLWPEALDLLGHLSEASRTRLAGLPAFHDPVAIEDIIRAAAAQGLWRDLVPLIDVLPAEVRESVPGIAAQIDADLLANVLGDAAAATETLPTLLSIVRGMDDAGRQKIVGLVDAADREVAEDLVNGLSDPAEIRALLAVVTPELLDAVSRAAARLGMEDVLARALAEAGAA